MARRTVHITRNSPEREGRSLPRRYIHSAASAASTKAVVPRPGTYIRLSMSNTWNHSTASATPITSACVKASGRGKRALNILVWSLIGLTAVILASALFRMLMYIGVYGLSLLRCMTLLIMAWIAIALAAAAYKTAKPDFHVFPVFLSSFLVLWLIFNYVDIDARIDDYHRAAYESGRILSYDSDYITSLGPSASENASLEWQNRVLFPSHE